MQSEDSTYIYGYKNELYFLGDYKKRQRWRWSLFSGFISSI